MLTIAIPLPAGLSHTIDNATGVVTITGVASTADYEAALALVEYTNTSDTPSDSQRTVCVSVNDGLEDSNVIEVAIQQRASFDGIQGLFRMLSADSLFIGSTAERITDTNFDPLSSISLTPFFAGHTTPGATIEVVIKDAVGNELGSALTVGDQAGNWSAPVHAQIAADAHYTVEIRQTLNYWGEGLYSGVERQGMMAHFEGAQVAHPDHDFSLSLGDMIGEIVRLKTVEQHVRDLMG